MARQDINLDPQCWLIKTEVWGTLGNYKHTRRRTKSFPLCHPSKPQRGDSGQVDLCTVLIIAEVSALASRGDIPVLCLLSWVLSEDMGLSQPQILHLWHSTFEPSPKQQHYMSWNHPVTFCLEEATSMALSFETYTGTQEKSHANSNGSSKNADTDSSEAFLLSCVPIMGSGTLGTSQQSFWILPLSFQYSEESLQP